MKKFIPFLAIVSAAGLLYATNAFGFAENVNNYVYYSPCSSPIEYKIGDVDSRFGISKNQFTQDALEAANVWDDSWGKEILVMDPSAKLSINLVYDERQSLNSQINNLQGQLKNDQNSISTQKSQYEDDVAAFNKKIDDLNKQIQYWNSQGGAPENVYKQLTDEQNQLRSEANDLNARARELNINAENFNSKVEQLNSTVNTFNQDLAQKPEEGLYMGPQDRIEIYLTNGHDELVHTLAHEMGHAIGLDHVGDKNAIMYAFTTQTTRTTNADDAELQKVCKKVAIWNRMATNVNYLFSSIKGKEVTN